MSSVMNLKGVEDTTFWKQLKNKFSGTTDDEIAQTLAINLKEICNLASDRMKEFPSLHPQYTLHDETHLLRVTELMAMIMPEDVLKKLNPIELALLILSAHFHDQGMVLDQKEIESLPLSPDFKRFRNSWEIEHPNIREIRKKLNDKMLSNEELSKCHRIEYELSEAQLTDYVRQTHGARSAQIIRSYDNNGLWEVGGTNLAYLVAKICESHVKSSKDLNHLNDFYHDQSVGQ